MLDTAKQNTEIVFLGGGHSNSLVLRNFGMRPSSKARLTLISDVTYAPYSGMLPGYLAGHYDYEETHINLRRLCEFSNTRFVRGKVIGINLDKRLIELENHPAIQYDILSINTGSSPEIEVVPGAIEHAVPVKPIPQFLASWQELEQKAENKKKQTLIFVGGGAGGVELALASKQRWGNAIDIHLIHQQPQLLDTHSTSVGNKLADICRQREINLHLGEEVTQVSQTGAKCRSGIEILGNHIFWSTGAGAPKWISDSGLAVDKQGFILVKNTLQSVSHPRVFAAGDIASIVNDSRPKAGVFAVRAAKPLGENLRRQIENRPLIEYHPQNRFLSLINLFDGTAIASRGAFVHRSPMMWKWKDRIDRKFMRQFTKLKSMQTIENVDFDNKSHSQDEQDVEMLCKGCAGKVGKPTLERVLNRLKKNYTDVVESEGTHIGIDRPDDAAVISIPSGKLLVQSLDFLSALVSDPYLLGRILAQHGYNDIFAMGATPHSASALVLAPHSEASLIEQDIYQSLAGICHELTTMKSSLLGGHTAESDQLGLAIQCNGVAEESQLLQKQGIQSGDMLLLTKPLGIGALFAAQMRLNAKGCWIDNAIETMLLSNQKAVELFRHFGATACTDVSGFGLGVHMLEMIEGTDISIEIIEEQIPAIEGALETIESGIQSSLVPQNRQGFFTSTNKTEYIDSPHFNLLFDPQTSGGLLASVPQAIAKKCLAELQIAGFSDCAIIGIAERRSSDQPPIVLSNRELQ